MFTRKGALSLRALRPSIFALTAPNMVEFVLDMGSPSGDAAIRGVSGHAPPASRIAPY
jgi:hypothetical protein